MHGCEWSANWPRGTLPFPVLQASTCAWDSTFQRSSPYPSSAKISCANDTLNSARLPRAMKLREPCLGGSIGLTSDAQEQIARSPEWCGEPVPASGEGLPFRDHLLDCGCAVPRTAGRRKGIEVSGRLCL